MFESRISQFIVTGLVSLSVGYGMIQLDRYRTTVEDTKIEDTKIEMPHRIFASSSKCNGLYDRLTFKYSYGIFGHRILEYYEEDLRREAALNGFDPETIEFYNCVEPSKKKPIPNQIIA